MSHRYWQMNGLHPITHGLKRFIPFITVPILLLISLLYDLYVLFGNPDYNVFLFIIFIILFVYFFLFLESLARRSINGVLALLLSLVIFVLTLPNVQKFSVNVCVWMDAPCSGRATDRVSVCASRHTFLSELLIVQDPSLEILRPFHERSAEWKDQIEADPSGAGLSDCDQAAYHVKINIYQVYTFC